MSGLSPARLRRLEARLARTNRLDPNVQAAAMQALEELRDEVETTQAQAAAGDQAAARALEAFVIRADAIADDIERRWHR